MVQAHIFVSGFVQGVGYRQFVKGNARRLGLTGWVRNLSDGRVEVVAQGKKKSIEQLILLCKTGPMLSEIKDIEVNWQAVDQAFETFEAEASA